MKTLTKAKLFKDFVTQDFRARIGKSLIYPDRGCYVVVDWPDSDIITALNDNDLLYSGMLDAFNAFCKINNIA